MSLLRNFPLSAFRSLFTASIDLFGSTDFGTRWFGFGLGLNMDWIGLDWIGLDWIGLGMGMDMYVYVYMYVS